MVIRYDSNFDYAGEIARRWNKEVRSLRIAGFVVGAALVALGVLCAIYSAQSLAVLGVLASVLIALLGGVQIAGFCAAPVFLRRGGQLVSGILNLLAGIAMLLAPSAVALETLTAFFGVLMLMFGVDLLAFSSRLSFFGISGFGWVVADGVLGILAGVLFLCAPMFSAVVLNYVLAAYLVVGGAALLVEAFSMKDLKVRE